MNQRPGILGKLVGQSEVDLEGEDHNMNIGIRTVAYRCQSCRQRHSVVYNNPAFASLSGHGSVSPSLVILAWWSFLEDKSITVTARELNLKAETVSDLYTAAMVIVADDAVHREQSVVFGGRGDLTTECEADESCFASWSVTGQNGEPDRHYFYVWVMVTQRGDFEKTWMAPFIQREDLPAGMSMCVGEKRVPPLNDAFWRVCGEHCFPEGGRPFGNHGRAKQTIAAADGR
jgi:hypothetical protein